jgi:hypothetical protein
MQRCYNVEMLGACEDGSRVGLAVEMLGACEDGSRVGLAITKTDV